MIQFWLARLTGATLTVGGVALATFINFQIPDKTLLHLAVMAVAAVISVAGIGIYEDVRRHDAVAHDDEKPVNGGLSSTQPAP